MSFACSLFNRYVYSTNHSINVKIMGKSVPSEGRTLIAGADAAVYSTYVRLLFTLHIYLAPKPDIYMQLHMLYIYIWPRNQTYTCSCICFTLSLLVNNWLLQCACTQHLYRGKFWCRLVAVTVQVGKGGYSF